MYLNGQQTLKGAPLTTEDMQIKPTILYQHLESRMTTIKNIRWGSRASRTLELFWWDYKLVKQLQNIT